MQQEKHRECQEAVDNYKAIEKSISDHLAMGNLLSEIDSREWYGGMMTRISSATINTFSDEITNIAGFALSLDPVTHAISSVRALTEGEIGESGAHAMVTAYGANELYRGMRGLPSLGTGLVRSAGPVSLLLGIGISFFDNFMNDSSGGTIEGFNQFHEQLDARRIQNYHDLEALQGGWRSIRNSWESSGCAELGYSL